ncbi:hypothetical protein [Pseudogulbenkiania sp. MAI-1]|uniref:hypothetical protein n=1 Tax=Pseudogulbenkiania sp. MAI-1 TaxID=990370 RepID=UPI00045E8BB8|nr:hypothetical protein [Pseudogulbenkiania sp. MAI-1]
MFFALLAATFLVALAASLLTAKFFDGAVNRILSRIVGDEMADAWRKYLRFAIVVVGVSGGVRLWELEKYVTATRESSALELNGMRWTLEIYRTLIETLQSVAWMMLLFFLCSMIAYVIVRAIELKHGAQE